jgi:uncharacterized protein (TIGR02118 family)
MTTMLALFRRPPGGPEALATFEQRYRDEHLPLIEATPGVREVRVRWVTQTLLGDPEVILVTEMGFDDRAALDAALGSDAMRAAGRNLREIAPGLTTLVVLEDLSEHDAAASPAVDTVETTPEERQ